MECRINREKRTDFYQFIMDEEWEDDLKLISHGHRDVGRGGKKEGKKEREEGGGDVECVRMA